jgi:hypothetical protein
LDIAAPYLNLARPPYPFTSSTQTANRRVHNSIKFIPQLPKPSTGNLPQNPRHYQTTKANKTKSAHAKKIDKIQ